MSGRRIGCFSDKDRVRFKYLPENTVFIWRGAVWHKSGYSSAWTSGKQSTTDCKDVKFPIKRRVLVSRSSGIAGVVKAGAKEHDHE